MDSIRPTKEANEKRRAQWLYQTKESRVNDMATGKAAARARRDARAKRLSDLQESAADRKEKRG